MAEFPVLNFFEKHHSLVSRELLRQRPGDCVLPRASVGQSRLKLLPVKWEEIGDGNINFVYRVWLKLEGSESPDISAVIKHAPTYIRCLGPTFLLTQSRLEIEYEAMCCFHQLHPNSVPTPIFYDRESSAVLMEYLDGFNVMRKDLVGGAVDLKAFDDVMIAIATIHQRTLKESLGGAEHEVYCEKYENPAMVSITNQYIFTKPYLTEDSTNRNHPLLNEEAQLLRDNRAICQRVEDLRKLFLEYHQCLCHGDLHTGSVMINDSDAKMFDLEFAFMGPASFDFGMFLANIIFAIIRHSCLKANLTVELLYQGLINAIKCYYQYSGSICKESSFKEETCGFIGCELVRRVVGAAHVEDLDTLPEGELLSLKLGKEFLLLQPPEEHTLIETVVTTLSKRL